MERASTADAPRRSHVRLHDVVAIARDRAIKTENDGTHRGGPQMRLETHYGKAEVSTYRT